MASLEDLRQFAIERHRENAALSRAYSKTLAALIPANFLLVVGAAILSLVAGATILIDQHVISTTTSAVLALISGAFTIIHSRLGCEQYQAECKKLVSFHRGMAVDYEHLRVIDDVADFRKQLTALNDEVSATVKNATSTPFQWALRSTNSRHDKT
jgi:hypothetical protein